MKKIRQPLGPFRTTNQTFDKGMRDISVTVHPTHLELRLLGRTKTYRLSYEQAYLRAISIESGMSTAPREGKQIKRTGI